MNTEETYFINESGVFVEKGLTETQNNDRITLVEMFQDEDYNGLYLDKDSIAELGYIMTLADCMAHIMHPDSGFELEKYKEYLLKYSYLNDGNWLLANYHLLPKKVRKILEPEMGMKKLAKAVKKLEALGFTADYDFSCSIFDLRKL